MAMGGMGMDTTRIINRRKPGRWKQDADEATSFRTLEARERLEQKEGYKVRIQ